MYLGQRESLLSPVGTSTDTRVDISSVIIRWRENNLDFPWHKFIDWFQQKYASGARTPLPRPELFYKTMDAFLSDIAQFEKELYGTTVSDVGDTIVADEEPAYDYPIEQPPSLPPDYYIPPSPAVAPEAFPWTYVAMGAGALVVILLVMKKRK